MASFDDHLSSKHGSAGAEPTLWEGLNLVGRPRRCLLAGGLHSTPNGPPRKGPRG